MDAGIADAEHCLADPLGFISLLVHNLEAKNPAIELLGCFKIWHRDADMVHFS